MMYAWISVAAEQEARVQRGVCELRYDLRAQRAAQCIVHGLEQRGMQVDKGATMEFWNEVLQPILLQIEADRVARIDFASSPSAAQFGQASPNEIVSAAPTVLPVMSVSVAVPRTSSPSTPHISDHGSDMTDDGGDCEYGENVCVGGGNGDAAPGCDEAVIHLGQVIDLDQKTETGTPESNPASPIRTASEAPTIDLTQDSEKASEDETDDGKALSVRRPMRSTRGKVEYRDKGHPAFQQIGGLKRCRNGNEEQVRKQLKTGRCVVTGLGRL